MRPLVEELPRHYQRSPQDAELQRAMGALLDQAAADLDFTLKQLFPSTASGWGLDLWEEAYALAPDPSLSAQNRTVRLLSKIRGMQTTTVERIRSIAEQYTDAPVWVRELFDEYRFEVWIMGTSIGDSEGFAAAINEVKPAHLDWEIQYIQVSPCPIYTGALPRQGDTILWKVDCT